MSQFLSYNHLMHKSLTLLIMGILIVSPLSLTSAQSLDAQGLVNWLWSQHMTIYTTIDQYRPNDLITRAESSKMISQYAYAVRIQQDYEGSCEFDDIEGFDETLVPYILASCKYGLIKGSNGVYSPNETLTQAQALTIIERARGWFEDETQEPRYRWYFESAVDLGIVIPDQLYTVEMTPITRLQLWEWLYAASRLINAELEPLSDDELQVYIPQWQVAPPPVVTSSTLWGPSTPQIAWSTSSSSSSSASTTTVIQDESKISWNYSWSLNFDTYQTYSDATLQYELTQGRRVVVFFGAQNEITSRALDTSIKNSGVWGNVVVLLAEYNLSQAARTTYGVTTPHTIVYLDAAGDVSFQTVKTDIQINTVIQNMDNGYAAGNTNQI